VRSTFPRPQHRDPDLEVVSSGPERLVFRDFAGLYGEVEREVAALRACVKLQALPPEPGSR